MDVANRGQIGILVDSVWPVVRTHDEPPNVSTRGSVPSDSIAPTIDKADDYEWYPSYREHQRETVIDAIEAFYIDDDDVVLLSAPTGAGKSLLIYAITAVIEAMNGSKSFSTTPLNTLIDQIDGDDFLNDVITIKGRNNYRCVHPTDRGTRVDKAVCQVDSDFDCEYKQRPHTSGGCPYYGRKMIAQQRAKVVTNLSFLMANSMIPDVSDAGFDTREFLAVDECQNVDDFALMFVGFTVSENAVPIDWDDAPDIPRTDDIDEMIRWLKEGLLGVVAKKIADLEEMKEMSITFTDRHQEQLDDLKRFERRVHVFLRDVEEYHWTMDRDDEYGARVEFKPVKVGRFLDDYLWSQANKVLAASATIPPNFLEEVGLDERSVTRIEVPSTFPPERRPVITSEAVGKMSYYERDKTLPKMADQIARIADLWEGHRGFIHAHSYSIAERIYDRLPRDVQRRTRLQDGDDREGSLQDWMDGDIDEAGPYSDVGGQVFISVAMAEGVSLDDDLARWQVVAKAAYPHMKDERVAYRMDDDTMGGAEWNWYASQAAVNLQQAVGRAVRSKEDWAATYVLDTSAVQLIERNEHLFEGWFLRAVDNDFDEDVVSPDNGNTSDQTGGDSSDRTSDGSLDDIAQKYFG